MDASLPTPDVERNVNRRNLGWYAPGIAETPVKKKNSGYMTNHRDLKQPGNSFVRISPIRPHEMRHDTNKVSIAIIWQCAYNKKRQRPIMTRRNYSASPHAPPVAPYSEERRSMIQSYEGANVA